MNLDDASHRPRARRGLPPGPTGHFLIGNFPLGSRDPLGLLSGWAKLYGDIFYYRAFHIHVYFINHPAFIESVLAANSRDFAKGRGLQVNKQLFGGGLLTAEGELWRRQRRLCQPPFHRERMESYARWMVSYTERTLEGWREGESRDLEADLRQLALEIVAKTLFDVEIGNKAREVGRALDAVMDFNGRGRILMPLVRFLPTPRNVRYQLGVRRLDGIVWAMIQERLSRGSEGNDLLSSL
ncbi:MAG: cytochrome P450, partial [Terriglobia bacterium]